MVYAGSYEFAQMKATASSDKDAVSARCCLWQGNVMRALRLQACGREPDELCRPATSTRCGFVEAQGAAIQVRLLAPTHYSLAPVRPLMLCVLIDGLIDSDVGACGSGHGTPHLLHHCR